MTPHRRRVAAARLVVYTLALLVAIWFLYRVFLRVAPAPPPPVLHSQFLVTLRMHA